MFLTRFSFFHVPPANQPMNQPFNSKQSNRTLSFRHIFKISSVDNKTTPSKTMMTTIA